MTVPESTFRRHVCGLSRAALADFVADLWAARGWDTSREERRVVACRERPRARRQVLAVWPRHRAVAGLLTGVSDDVDVVVAPVGPRVGEALASRTGREVVDAHALHELVSYAGDDGDRTRLLDEELGWAPSEAAGTDDPPSPPVTALATSGPVRRGASAALVVVLATGIGPPVLDGVPSSDANGPTATGTPTALATGSGESGCGANPAALVARELADLRSDAPQSADGPGVAGVGPPPGIASLHDAIVRANAEGLLVADDLRVVTMGVTDDEAVVLVTARENGTRTAAHELHLVRPLDGGDTPCWVAASVDLVYHP